MNTIRCPQCNLVNFSTAISCKRCGFFFQEVEAATQTQPTQESFPNFNQSNVTPNSYQAPPLNPPRQNFQQPNYQNYSRPVNQKIGMAITSLVLGIVGCFLTSPLGLIFGIVSLRKANKFPFEYGGKTLAIIGIVLNALQLLALPIVFAIAIPNFLAARQSANEASAVRSVQSIGSAQFNYMSSTNTRNCGDLSQLSQKGLIDSGLVSGTKHGYLFVIVRLPQGCEIYATPTNAQGLSATGNLSFYYSTEENVFRGAKKGGKLADANDPPIGYGNAPQPPRIATR